MKCFRNPKKKCVVKDNEEGKLCWACNYDPQMEKFNSQLKKEEKC
jgi:hypothetical protein